MDTVVDLAVAFEVGANVATVTPRSGVGRVWLRSAPFEPWQRLGDAVGVDVRVVDRLVSDAETDGLVVEEVAEKAGGGINQDLLKDCAAVIIIAALALMGVLTPLAQWTRATRRNRTQCDPPGLPPKSPTTQPS